MKGSGRKTGINTVYTAAIVQIIMTKPAIRPRDVTDMIINDLDLDEGSLYDNMPSEKQMREEVL